MIHFYGASLIGKKTHILNAIIDFLYLQANTNNKKNLLYFLSFIVRFITNWLNFHAPEGRKFYDVTSELCIKKYLMILYFKWIFYV
jgi:hypothetical protein